MTFNQDPLTPSAGHLSPAHSGHVLRARGKQVMKSFVRPEENGPSVAELTAKRSMVKTLRTTEFRTTDFAGSPMAKPPEPATPQNLRVVDAKIDAKVRRLHAPTDTESAIVRKEEQLEQIMSMEAFAGFEQMGRHQLKRSMATRNAIDPDKLMQGTLDIDLGDEDLHDEVCELDNGLVDECGLE